MRILPYINIFIRVHTSTMLYAMSRFIDRLGKRLFSLAVVLGSLAMNVDIDMPTQKEYKT